MITKQLLEGSLKEHQDMQEMVSKGKYQTKDEHSFAEAKERSVALVKDEEVKEYVRSDRFEPAGSILYGAGKDQDSASLSNCYLTPIEKDTIGAIYECQKNMALTFARRGGTGITLDILRPKGSNVNNAAVQSSGAVSFMPDFSSCVNTIGMQGRRGALIMTLDIRHPDIPLFIKCKSHPEEVFGKDPLTGRVPDISGANISLAITKEFMEAVKNDADWTFWFPDIEGAGKDFYNEHWDGDFTEWKAKGYAIKEYQTVSARSLLNDISESASMCGDPGIMFISAIQENTLGTYIHKCLKPMGINPCAEEPLAYWNNCLLGAMVLPKYVKNPFTKEPVFDIALFLSDTRLAVRALNDFSDANEDRHPLQQQRDADKFGKRIGLEVTGLADMLAMMNLPYDSEEARKFVSVLFRDKALMEIHESLQIAQERGKPCPALSTPEARQGLINAPYFKNLIKEDQDEYFAWPTDLIKNIKDYGLANTAFNTVGPCGSISIIAGNCSSGVEPIFRFAYTRKNRIDGKTYSFIHRPACEYMLKNLEEFEGLTLKQAAERLNYQESQDIDKEDRLKMQAAIQEFTDSAISSTLNLPSTATKEDIASIYQMAYDLNLKGVTVFRDGCKEGVLASIPKKEPNTGSRSDCRVIIQDLLDVEQAERIRAYWKGKKLYINVSLTDEGQPIEVFAKLPIEAGINGEGVYNPALWQERTSNWDLACRLISLNLRAGIPLNTILKQLDRSTYSMVDAAGILKRVLQRYVPDSEEGDEGQQCPECKEMEYFYEGGCGICKACGFTTCG